MLIGVPAETAAGETRVAVTPETAKKLIAQGHVVRVQSNAGLAASITDEALRGAGAEITDAAMGERAECVMLNKGPHILDAMRMLDDILRRMQSHQIKKRPLLRALSAWSARAGSADTVITREASGPVE